MDELATNIALTFVALCVMLAIVDFLNRSKLPNILILLALPIFLIIWIIRDRKLPKQTLYPQPKILGRDTNGRLIISKTEFYNDEENK